MSYGKAVEIPLLSGAALTSPAAPGTVLVAAVPGFGKYAAIDLVATLQGATGGTLDFILQKSADNVHFYDYWRPLSAPLAAAAPAATYKYTPSLNNTLLTIGLDGVPALAAGTASGGHWFEFLRVLWIAGAGTSAGAVQNVRVLAIRSP